MKKISPIVIIILPFALVLSVSLSSKKENKGNDELITSEEIREIIREELKNELSNLEVKVDSNSIDVDYDRIEEIVENKLEEFNKGFGENFEEATSYFGEKIKGTINDIESHMKK